MGFVDFALILRIVAYALMVPSALVLGVREWNAQRPRVAALLGLYSLAHLLALLSVVLDLYDVPRTVTDRVRLGLTPIVLMQAVLYLWVVIRWLRHEWSNE